ncbi:GIDE domain-containing protein [Salinigranum marinum]|uniref:GIDE domain-containing protein n=1 Tax=Salinigranum marinum TaxID=1515595 RepID=UPI002989EB28|nr:GIDE domain-containing protein [Salinigranum marinum]
MDDSGRQTVPFRLVDDDGSVNVDPTEADLHLSSAHYDTFVNAGRAPGEQALRFTEQVQENERRCHEAGTKRIHNTPINEATVHGTGGIHYESRVLQPGDTGYVLGPARSDGDGTYTIGTDNDAEFIISDMSKDALSESLGSSQWLFAGVALLFYGLAAYLIFLARSIQLYRCQTGSPVVSGVVNDPRLNSLASALVFCEIES